MLGASTVRWSSRFHLLITLHSLARFGPSACQSARPFVCPALLVPECLVSHAPAAARAVYSGPQLAVCRLCLPPATVSPSKPRPWSHVATILLLYIDYYYYFTLILTVLVYKLYIIPACVELRFIVLCCLHRTSSQKIKQNTLLMTSYCTTNFGRSQFEYR